MDLEVAAIHSQTDKSSAVMTRSLGISTTAISRSDAGRATDGSRLQTCNDLQVPVIPITLGASSSIFNERDSGGSSLCAKGWRYASKVPIGPALRPRIHRASGGPEAPSGDSRMAVAARASQYRALPCAGRAGSGTAERTRAPLFARTPLIGARGARVSGGTVP